MKNQIRLIGRMGLMLGLVAFASACGEIPSHYRGEYAENSNGARLELTSSGGTIVTPEGHTIEADVEDLEFENLMNGQKGIYLEVDSKDENLLHVHWINPDLSSKKTEGGQMWFRSEYAYTLIQLNERGLQLDKEGRVPGILVKHCLEGRVHLDLVEKLYQMDCSPRNRQYYQFTRAD